MAPAQAWASLVRLGELDGRWDGGASTADGSPKSNQEDRGGVTTWVTLCNTQSLLHSERNYWRYKWFPALGIQPEATRCMEVGP